MFGGLARVGKKLKHVLVVGVPGSGKTTFATRYAKKNGMDLVSIDGIPKKKGFPNTADLRKLMDKLDKPTVIEGYQIAGLTKSEVAGHKVITMKHSKKTIIDRLERRGLVDENNVLHKGKNNKYIKEQYSKSALSMKRFENRI